MLTHDLNNCHNSNNFDHFKAGAADARAHGRVSEQGVRDAARLFAQAVGRGEESARERAGGLEDRPAEEGGGGGDGEAGGCLQAHVRRVFAAAERQQ